MPIHTHLHTHTDMHTHTHMHTEPHARTNTHCKTENVHCWLFILKMLCKMCYVRKLKQYNRYVVVYPASCHCNRKWRVWLQASTCCTLEHRKSSAVRQGPVRSRSALLQSKSVALECPVIREVDLWYVRSYVGWIDAVNLLLRQGYWTYHKLIISI